MKNELTVFDDPKNVKRLLLAFYICLLVLLIIDPFVQKHGDFEWEDMPGFFAAYGFISCVLLIVVARILRMWLKRDEDYYD